MDSASQTKVCTLFATMVGSQLARSLTEASGADWEIEPASPSAEPPAAVESSTCFRMDFDAGLHGACYLVLGEADLAVFTAKQRANGEGKSEASTESQSDESATPAAHFLAILKSAAAALHQALEAAHGYVSAEAALASSLDPLAVEPIQLAAKNPAGIAAHIVLHFDPALIASLIAALEAGEPGTHANPVPEDHPTQTNLELVMDVELDVTLRFGQRQLSLREILELTSGSVVELDRQVDEPVELILDGRVIARGEAVIIDGNYGLRVTQVMPPIVY